MEGIRRGRGAGDLVPAGRASSAARAHALAATYFRPRAVPSVQAIASAAALSAPPRASAKRSGVAARNRHAAVAEAMVAMVPPRVEPWPPSRGMIVRCW